jgi:hypothetical protein
MVARLGRCTVNELRRRWISALLLCVVSSITLGEPQDVSESHPTSIVRIYVNAGGVITVNGNIVSAANLNHSLQSLKPTPTEVWYSRANVQGEPPPGGMAVMEAIVALRLPVAFYTDETFKTRVKLR